ncbi:MAG: AbrB/MazE/SpoVT family DNA-binding domain-containing protein [Nitratireductor sp.]
MKIDIIKVGNSKGIRIPKAMLESCAIGDAVELEVQDGKLVLSAITKLREGWEQSFQEMAANGDDELLVGDDVSPDPQEVDWEW